VVIGVETDVFEVVVFATGANAFLGVGGATGLVGTFGLAKEDGTNWFMPALVNSRLGLSGIRLEDGTMVCCFDLKKSRKSFRTWLLGRFCELVIMVKLRWGD